MNIETATSTITVPDKYNYIDVIAGNTDVLDPDNVLGTCIRRVLLSPGDTVQIKCADEWEIKTKTYPSTPDSEIQFVLLINKTYVIETHIHKDFAPILIEMAKTHCAENGIRLIVNGEAV